ncbi:MAG: ribonuclease HI [Rickettsiales bacterium]|nr:ribonuclease HI [Rickettsiales bacterium]|tara:strand:- start:60497 stop:60940 length:444 start_codon:yes stop_codon:yes gene_type:complete
MNKDVYIYTDGGCHGNPGPGAWAALLRWQDQEKELSGFEQETTNNRMELTAAIQALQHLKRPMTVHLYSDSQYVVKGMTTYIIEWRQNDWHAAIKKKIKNLDLWQKLDELSTHHNVTWHWVRGHNGHPENEYVDGLVQKEIIKHTEG